MPIYDTELKVILLKSCFAKSSPPLIRYGICTSCDSKQRRIQSGFSFKICPNCNSTEVVEAQLVSDYFCYNCRQYIQKPKNKMLCSDQCGSDVILLDQIQPVEYISLPYNSQADLCSVCYEENHDWYVCLV